MTDAGFDQIGRIELQRAGQPQAKLEGRKPTAQPLHQVCVHADRSAKLSGRVGKAMHDRAQREMPGGVHVVRLDPPARGGDETGGRGRLGPRFGSRTVPVREPRFDRTAPLRRQGRGGQVPVFVEPGHYLAAGRIDEAMAKAQLVIDTERRAFDMKTAAGAQFLHEAGIEPAWQIAAARQIAEGKVFGEIRCGLFHPIEVIGDGEMLGDVALPGWHRAAMCLGPIGHQLVALTLWLATDGSRRGDGRMARPICEISDIVR